MAAKISVLGPVRSNFHYLRFAQGRFPLMKVCAAESIEIKEVYCADAVDQIKMQIADEDASLRKYDQNI